MLRNHSSSAYPRSPRQTNVPAYDEMLLETSSCSADDRPDSVQPVPQQVSIVTPPQQIGVRQELPFVTPMRSTNRAFRKEKVAESELSSIREASISCDLSVGGGLHTVREACNGSINSWSGDTPPMGAGQQWYQQQRDMSHGHGDYSGLVNVTSAHHHSTSLISQNSQTSPYFMNEPPVPVRVVHHHEHQLYPNGHIPGQQLVGTVLRHDVPLGLGHHGAYKWGPPAVSTSSSTTLLVGQSSVSTARDEDLTHWQKKHQQLLSDKDSFSVVSELKNLKMYQSQSESEKDILIQDLQKKLGAAEYDLLQLQKSVKETQPVSKSDWDKTKKELSIKSEKLTDIQKKYNELADRYKTVCEKNRELESYVADFPTHDEQSKKNQKLNTLQENELCYQQKIEDISKALSDTVKAAKNKDGKIETLEKESSCLKTKLTSLEGDLQRIRELQTSNLQKEYEDLEWENQKLKSDLKKAKEVVEARRKKFQQQEAKQQKYILQLEDRMGQEETTVNALRDELNEKDEHHRKLTTSVKDLTKKCQEFRERNLILQSKAVELERILSSQQIRLEEKLINEVTSCVTELTTLVNTCLEQAEGQDPNLSMLLGVKAAAANAQAADDAPSTEKVLRQKILKVRELRKDIDGMKEKLASKFAEDMGENLNCTTQ